MAFKLTDVDKGYDRMMRAVGKTKQGRRLRVGVKSDPETEQVASWQEFGTVYIPPRSFLRAWFDGNRGRIENDLKKLAAAAIKGPQTREELLTALGHKYAEEIQNRILSGIAPELKWETLLQKRRRGDPDTALVTAEARLLSSVVAMLDDEVV